MTIRAPTTGPSINAVASCQALSSIPATARHMQVTVTPSAASVRLEMESSKIPRLSRKPQPLPRSWRA